MNYFLKKTIVLLIIIVSWGSTSGMSTDEFFAKCDEFMSSYVNEGLVGYASIRHNHDDIHALIQFIAKAPVNNYETTTAKAFYLNAYNLIVIESVVRHLPINSPMDVSGFFDQEKHKIGEEELTLNDIENKKIRTPYNDPRIHFVLVCAAKGCPKIASFAYKPSDLERQLNQQTIKGINEKEFIKRKGETVFISEIFKWYYKDFANSDTDLIKYLNKYLNEKLPINSKINYYSYDWSLNELIIE